MDNYILPTIPGAVPSDRDASAFPGIPDSARGANRLAAPLIFEFPPVGYFPFGFQQIDLPTGLQVAAGNAGWFKLDEVDVPGDTLQEVVWSGVQITMAPCDITGAGDSRLTPAAGSWKKWGDDTAVVTNSRNTHACIVIGQNLPGKLEEWVEGPIIQAGQGAVGNAIRMRAQRVVDYAMFPFPGGTFAATATIGKASIITRDLPCGMRLTNGSKLGIALVVQRSLVHNLGAGTAGSIAGHVSGFLSFGKRSADGGYNT